MTKVTCLALLAATLAFGCGGPDLDAHDEAITTTPGTACEGLDPTVEDLESPCDQGEQQLCLASGVWSECVDCQNGVLVECEAGIVCTEAGVGGGEPSCP